MKASSPWKTLKELVEYAKANPDKVRVGNSGQRQPDPHRQRGAVHIGRRQDHAGARQRGQATVNLLGDRIEAAVQFPQAVVPHVKSGDLRVLAHAGHHPRSGPSPT